MAGSINNNFVGAYVTDCTDANAIGRLGVEFQRLFGVTPTIIGVGSYSGLEVGGNLADLLDRLKNGPLADRDQPGVVLGNTAPRDVAIKQRWENGTPFCYFWLDRILVATTLEEKSLALLRDLGIVEQVEVTDLATVIQEAVAWGDLTSDQARKIRHTQFRSLEYLPLLAWWIWNGKNVPSETYSLANFPSVDNLVWHIDNFGNAKTTLKGGDVKLQEGQEITLAVDGQKAVRYARLADVPDGVTAVITGSSGFGKHRFLEVVVGGKGRAVDRHRLTVGSPVIVK
jgi:hypothetical protein